MMQVFDIPVWGPSKNVPQDDAQYTLNMYPEKTSEDVYTLKARAGHVVTSQVGFAGPGRGQISVGGRYFGIRGVAFCEVVNGVSVTRGTLATNSGICSLVACLPPNGDGQILIVGPNDNEGYVFELATNTFTVLTEVTHGFVSGGGQTVFFGGRAWGIKKGTGQFQCSEPYNFLSWPGDAFGTAEFDSDELVGIDTDGNYLLLLGKYTGETWVFQNTTPLPVMPTNSTFRIGLLAAQAHICFENDFYWFGGNAEGKGVVYALSAGGEPRIISDYTIARNIAPLVGQSDAFMYAYQDLGHRFIFLTFPEAGRTFVYDISEGVWHEEGYRIVPSGNMVAMPWVSVVFHEGSLLGLNRTNGQVAQIRDDLYTDNGNPIILERKLSVLPKEASWKSYFREVELFSTMGNTPPPSESTYANVITGTSLVSEPVLHNEVARYIYVGYYVGSGMWVAFAFSSAAARESYIQGQQAIDGFLGFAVGPINGEEQEVNILDGAMNPLVSFQMAGISEEGVTFSFDILRQIVQPDNSPNVMLRVSRDRGMTWGTEMWRKQSGNGSYICRTRWTGIGAAWGITLWFRFVANQPVSFRGVRVYAEGGG